jgi:ankyrin repeat protein
MLPYSDAALKSQYDKFMQTGDSDLSDNPELIKALLKHGANPYINDSRGEGHTLLHYAALRGHSATVRILLENQMDPNAKDNQGNTPLMFAEFDCARLLIEYRADVNARNNQGETALMLCDNPKTSQLLLDHKADVNAQDKVGQTALLSAVRSGERVGVDLTRARILLQQGAKVSIKDKNGKTVLDYARADNVTAVIPILEEAAKHEQTTR